MSYDPPPPEDLTPSEDARNVPAGAYKHDLVDLRRISEKLNVPLDTVNKWRYRELLPPPDYPELRNPVWNWETIEAWAKATGRLQVDR